MQLIRKRAFARAGLVGNPSDGYHGKTISAIVRNFWAEVTLYEWDQIEIVLSQEDRSRFRSIAELAHDVKLHGYYGGVRLVKATIKRFFEYCRANDIPLHDRNFSIRYETNIPRQLGLAGSSAIIVATLRCLMDFYGIDIARRVQPSLVLSVETEELGIAAGLQDRVIQVYEGVVYMDFSEDRTDIIHGFPCGTYEPLDPALLPPLYLAFNPEISEPTEVIHNDLRGRYRRGDPEVVEAMKRFAALTDEARDALLRHDAETFSKIMDANFDLRRSILKLAPEHVEMVRRARRAGASAKFAGSGGAIVGCVPDAETFQRLTEEMAAIGCRVIRPKITPEILPSQEPASSRS
ncbi:hypothetical protein JCM19992_05570 [Thermostilla marina]